MKKLYLLPLLILLVIGFVLVGCGPSTPTATQPTATQPTATQPTATQPTATQPTSTTPGATQPTTTAPSATKTLKFGFITDLTSTLGNQIWGLQQLMCRFGQCQGRSQNR